MVTGTRTHGHWSRIPTPALQTLRDSAHFIDAVIALTARSTGPWDHAPPRAGSCAGSAKHGQRPHRNSANRHRRTACRCAAPGRTTKMVLHDGTNNDAAAYWLAQALAQRVVPQKVDTPLLQTPVPPPPLRPPRLRRGHACSCMHRVRSRCSRLLPAAICPCPQRAVE